MFDLPAEKKWQIYCSKKKVRMMKGYHHGRVSSEAKEPQNEKGIIMALGSIGGISSEARAPYLLWYACRVCDALIEVVQPFTRHT